MRLPTRKSARRPEWAYWACGVIVRDKCFVARWHTGTSSEIDLLLAADDVFDLEGLREVRWMACVDANGSMEDWM